MLQGMLTEDEENGPSMMAPDNMKYGRELSRVETRDIDKAAIEHAKQLMRSKRLAPVRVLDFGCGTGHSAETFARLGCHVTGVDMRRSHEDILERNQRLLADGFHPIHFIHSDICDVNIEDICDKPWDIIYLNRILHFLPETSVKNIMTALVEASSPDTHFVINFRSSDYKTPGKEGCTYIESDEDGCIATYYLHNARRFITMLQDLGCSLALHEEHDRLCLLFVKNSPREDIAPHRTLDAAAMRTTHIARFRINEPPTM
jgi:SAM-dependent methyltransferase